MPPNGPTSSPDVTITYSHLGRNANWVIKITLKSDHLPIVIDPDGCFAEPTQAGPSCYTNFRKAIGISPHQKSNNPSATSIHPLPATRERKYSVGFS